MNRFIQGLLPQMFANEWTLNAERNRNHAYHLRNDADIYVPFARTSFVENSSYHSFPRAWINFNVPEIKIQREKNVLNKLLKNYFCSQLSDNFICTRLLCPSCHLNRNIPIPAVAGPISD